MGKTYQRKQVLVYPKFQLSLITIQIVIIVSVVGLIAYHAMKSYGDLNAMGVEANLPEGHPYFKFVEYHSNIFVKNLIFGSILGIVVSTFLSLVLSHRLAGPIVRLKSYLESISNKRREDIKPLHFRKYDFFTELAPIVNHTIAELIDRERNQK